MLNELERVLAERIERDGPMPFAAFMSQALYHPRHGYYTSGAERTGWRGHFLTSAELDPSFGALWVNGLEQIWNVSGEPSTFHVVEVGPGEGGFAAAVIERASGPFKEALRYVLVERVAAVAQRQRERLAGTGDLEWVASVNEIDPFPIGCVFANEVLDNLPVHLVERRDEALLELCVELADGRFILTHRPPPQPELQGFLDRAGVSLSDGHRYEIQLAAESFIARTASLVQRGAVILIDYGADAHTLAERPGGTLLCYSTTGVDDEPLERVGEKDITVHVNWTIVGDACRRAGLRVIGPQPQRRVLRGLGLTELDRSLKEEHDRAIETGQGANAVRTISKRQALGALADPAGLGGLDVVVALRDIGVPAFLQ